MHSNPFTDAELERRVAATRRQMEARSLDMILLSSPENIFYLIGLDPVLYRRRLIDRRHFHNQ